MSIRGRFFIRTATLTLGIVMAALGIWLGEMTDVLRKAVVVCLECVGIG